MICSGNVNNLTVLKFFSLEQRVKQHTRNFHVILGGCGRLLEVVLFWYQTRMTL